MKINNNSKSQGLPVNIIVMMIIGIIIFALGLTLFSKFSSSGEAQISDLNNQIKTDISNLECNSNEWICIPSYKMKNGDKKTFQVFIVNNDDVSKEFKIKIKTTPIPASSSFGITNSKCGSIILDYPSFISTKIQSGMSASIPFQIIANRVTKTPCSFVTTATLITPNKPSTEPGNNEKTALIIRVG